MSYIQDATDNAAFGKLGIYGNAKSGKTRTAAEIAIGLHKLIKSKKPVGMFDTEPGHQFVNPLYKKAEIKLKVYDKSRAFVDLMGWLKEILAISDILIIDSISHVWKELQAAALVKVNEERSKYNKRPISRLEFHHWAAIKSEFNKFTDLYLNCKAHIIICGRAGAKYDYQENEETGKKELITTGTKMSAEKEMGYEPSLLIEMQKVYEKTEYKGKIVNIINRAFIEGDRADLLNGQSFDFPTFDTFKPHFDFLNIGGEHFEIENKTSKELFTPEGNDQWFEEKKQRSIICEEIQGIFINYFPKQDANSKQKKIELLEKHFGTRSWTKVETTNSGILKRGYTALKLELTA